MMDDATWAMVTQPGTSFKDCRTPLRRRFSDYCFLKDIGDEAYLLQWSLICIGASFSYHGTLHAL